VRGLVREMVAGYYFGVAGAIYCFTVAFQIPNLVRALVAAAGVWAAVVARRFVSVLIVER
jgi:putative peptidoglycan lipid II flippase